MVLRQTDRRLGLVEALDAAISDPRAPDLITHRQVDLLWQRIYGVALGYEDLNDHDTLRKDLVWQSAVERDTELASSPTLCRLENRADREPAWAMSRVLVEQFIASFKVAPAELILDFDATDDRVHGLQEGRFFHGYYGDWCFLPLYVFCGEQLLVSYLRPSNIDVARHAWAILKLLVRRLREEWPGVKIILRGLRVSEDRVCGGAGGVSFALQGGTAEVPRLRTRSGARRRGSRWWRIRAVPIGLKEVVLVTEVPRCQCQECGKSFDVSPLLPRPTRTTASLWPGSSVS
jgi:hypothetical protein